jgi:hypothetical protein
VRGAIVDGGLTVVYPMTKAIVSGISPANGLCSVGLVNNSAGFNAAEGDHRHGQNGYSNVGGTGVSSHTHPVTFGSQAFPSSLDNGRFGDTSAHAGHTSANGSHNHFYSVIEGNTQSNTSTLKLKKDISDYEVPEIKNLLNLQNIKLGLILFLQMVLHRMICLNHYHNMM